VLDLIRRLFLLACDLLRSSRMTSEVSVVRRDASAPAREPAETRSPQPPPLEHPFTPLQGWVRLGAERERALTCAPPQRNRRVQQLILAPMMAVGVAISVFGLIHLVGVAAALGLAVGLMLVVRVLVGLPVTRGWIHHERELCFQHEAVMWRNRILGLIRDTERRELAYLSRLVENVRGYAQLPYCMAVTPAVVGRLDRLLLAYVDRAVEMRATAGAYAVTEADAPRFPLPSSSPSVKRLRVLAMRADAREACRRRIEALQEQLSVAGEVVRMLHEQAFASSPASRHDLDELVGELLDDAESADEARSETRAFMEHPRRTALALAFDAA
jgi:hypothetical protein